MGFFDSYITDGSAAGATGATGTSGTAVADVTPSKKSKKAVESDFLIIDDNVTVESVPNTAESLFAPTESVASEGVILFDAPSEVTPSSEVITSEVSDVTFDVEKTTSEVSVSEVASSSAEVVPISENSTQDIIDSSLVSEVIMENSTEILSETSPELTIESSSQEVASVEINSFFSTPTPEVIPETSSVVTSTEVVSSDEAIQTAIAQVSQSITSKEVLRDAELAKNESILAQIAELKKQSKAAQDKAREHDASADRDRKLMEGLKALIA